MQNHSLCMLEFPVVFQLLFQEAFNTKCRINCLSWFPQVTYKLLLSLCPINRALFKDFVICCFLFKYVVYNLLFYVLVHNWTVFYVFHPQQICCWSWRDPLKGWVADIPEVWAAIEQLESWGLRETLGRFYKGKCRVLHPERGNQISTVQRICGIELPDLKFSTFFPVTTQLKILPFKIQAV